MTPLSIPPILPIRGVTAVTPLFNLNRSTSTLRRSPGSLYHSAQGQRATTSISRSASMFSSSHRGTGLWCLRRSAFSRSNLDQRGPDCTQSNPVRCFWRLLNHGTGRQEFSESTCCFGQGPGLGFADHCFGVRHQQTNGRHNHACPRMSVIVTHTGSRRDLVYEPRS